MTGIPPAIRDLLVCPVCRGPLRDATSADRVSLVCEACRLAYPVEEGIPVLLAERAEPLEAS